MKHGSTIYRAVAGLLWVPALILGVLVACSGSSSNDDGCPTCPPPPDTTVPALVVNAPAKGAIFVKDEPIPCSVKMEPHNGQQFIIAIEVDGPGPARIICIDLEGDNHEGTVLAYDVARTHVLPEVGDREVIYRLHRVDNTRSDFLGEIVREKRVEITVVPAED